MPSINSKLIAVFFFFSIFLSTLVIADIHKERVKLGDHYLMIPNKYMKDSSSPPPWLKSILGMDDGSRELLLTIDSSEVAKNIDGFIIKDGHYKNNVRIRLSEITKEEKDRYLDPRQFSNAWRGTGSYEHAVVEGDSLNGFTRIYRRSEYPKSWALFKDFSHGKMPSNIYSSWVGHCIEARSPLTPSGTLTLCKSYVIYGNIAVNFTVSDRNISKIDALRKYLSGMVSSWVKAH